MKKPEVMIRSHMPFDPLWQFLNYPLTYQEFHKNDFRVHKTRPFFNFRDTLQSYEDASELDKAIAGARRIEQNGEKNSFAAAKLRILNGDVDFLRNKLAAEKYDSAVNIYNAGISRMNLFISYRNNQYVQGMDSLQLTHLLDSTEVLFTNALKNISGIKAPDENIITSIDQLKNAIRESMMALNEQRVFLYGYLKTRR
jgi:hypothetical protein